MIWGFTFFEMEGRTLSALKVEKIEGFRITGEAVDEKPVGTVFIQLFNETVPITAENFRLLSTGLIFCPLTIRDTAYI